MESDNKRLVKHWGEFEECSEDHWGDHNFSLSDYEELLTPQHHPPSSTALHQPSPHLTSSFQILSGESTRSDVMVQNTIRLLQHIRHVSHLINRAQNPNSSSSGGSSSEGNAITLPPCPPLPAEIPLPRSSQSSLSSSQDGGLSMEVQHGTARKMLRQAVALVLAHTGFTDTTDTVLRTLADLTHEFMTKFTQLLRVNADSTTLNLNYCPFHDVLEQTMRQMNVGGLLDLQKMYIERVQDYYSNVKENALQLTNHYNQIINKQAPQPANSSWSGNTVVLGSGTAQYSTVFPTAGGGSVNITIGALPGNTSLNFPNLSAAGSSPEEGTNVEALGGGRSVRLPATGVVINSGRAAALQNSNRTATLQNSGIISLEQELSRQYTPLSGQEGDARNQNSPLAAHFTINQR